MALFLSFFDDLGEPAPDDAELRRPEPQRSPRAKGAQRLAILALGLIVVIVAGFFLVQRCQRDREVSSYQTYVGQANEVAKASANVGSEFSSAILTAGQTPAGLDEAITRQIQAQRQIAANAAALEATEGLQPYQPFLVQSMQYRVSGLQGMQKALQEAFQAAGTTGQVPLEQAAAVAATFQRLIASDVVYTDSYQDPSKQILAQREITASVDNSQFVDPKLIEFAAPQRMQSILDALIGGSPVPEGGEEGTDTGGDTTGVLHGTTLMGAVYAPGDISLDPGIVNEVDSANEMAFAVTVQNSGDATEVAIQVNVTLRAQGMDDRTLATGEITTLDPGAEATVEIPFGLSDIVFDDVVTAKITVEKVPGEENVDNNIGVYEIQFRLNPT